jgi:hypothetical protein
MSRPLIWLALLVSPLVAWPCPGQPAEPPTPSLPVDSAAERELLEIGGPGLRLRRTEHFVVAYNTSDESLTALISRLEATHRSVYRFCRINELPARPLSRRLQVLFFDTYDEYARIAQAAGFSFQGSVGFYSQRTNVATFYNMFNSPELSEINRLIEQAEGSMERLRGTRPIDRQALQVQVKERSRLVNVRDRTVERINRSTVQHETAHQLLFNAGVHVLGAHNPHWLVEGLACLFETPPSASGAGAGAVNQLRLADFRACLGDGDAGGKLKHDDLGTALAGGKFVPLRRLVSDPTLFTRRADPNLVHHYSQAWALVCYLQRAKREQFAEYLRLLGQRQVGQAVAPEQEIADFESIFGPLDERFERRWAVFILTKMRFKPSELN